MSSKRLIFPLVLAFTLHGLSMQATSDQAIDDAGRNPILVHITNVMPASNLPHVSMRIRVGHRDFLPSVSLSGGQEYQLKAAENNSYKAVAVFGFKFAAFDPYVPTRDKGQAAVYWKVDDVGFYIRHDGSKWKLDAPWESADYFSSKLKFQSEPLKASSLSPQETTEPDSNWETMPFSVAVPLMHCAEETRSHLQTMKPP